MTHPLVFLLLIFTCFRKKLLEIGNLLYICDLNHPIAINQPHVT